MRGSISVTEWIWHEAVEEAEPAYRWDEIFEGEKTDEQRAKEKEEKRRKEEGEEKKE